MTKPYMSELRSGVIGKRFTTFSVAKVPVRTQDSILQKLWIVAYLKHFLIIIGFKNEVISLSYVSLHLLCDMSHVSHKAEYYSIMLHSVAHIVRTIMRNTEWSDQKITDFDLLILFYHMSETAWNFLVDTIISPNAFVYFTRSMDWNVIFSTKSANRLYVISVVMRHKYILNALNLDVIIMQVLLQFSYCDTCIEKQSIGSSGEIVAVTTTSTSERYKF